MVNAWKNIYQRFSHHINTEANDCRWKPLFIRENAKQHGNSHCWLLGLRHFDSAHLALTLILGGRRLDSLRLCGDSVRSIADGVATVSFNLTILRLLGFHALPFGSLIKRTKDIAYMAWRTGVGFLCCCVMIKLTTSGKETAGNEGAKVGSLTLGFTPSVLRGQIQVCSHMPEVLEFFSLQDLLDRLWCLWVARKKIIRFPIRTMHSKTCWRQIILLHTCKLLFF